MSPSNYRQPPTPDHPPPSAKAAEKAILARIRPLSQVGEHFIEVYGFMVFHSFVVVVVDVVLNYFGFDRRLEKNLFFYLCDAKKKKFFFSFFFLCSV